MNTDYHDSQCALTRMMVECTCDIADKLQAEIERLQRRFEVASQQAAHWSAVTDEYIDMLKERDIEIERLSNAEQRLINLFTTPEGETTLVVNISRHWDRPQIERFALHLLGEDATTKDARLTELERIANGLYAVGSFGSLYQEARRLLKGGA
jgi:hypothetical protein